MLVTEDCLPLVRCVKVYNIFRSGGISLVSKAYVSSKIFEHGESSERGRRVDKHNMS